MPKVSGDKPRLTDTQLMVLSAATQRDDGAVVPPSRLKGSVLDIETIASREHMSRRAARMALSLAFIAPDIIEAVVLGTLPRGFTISRLTDLLMNWAEQRKCLGLVARA